MNRETEARFSLLPTIENPRSIFDRSNQVKTSFNAGELIPIELWQDVMPGDTIQMSTAEICRMVSSLKTPVMDNAYLDVFYFFVPNRLVMEDWQKFMGENDDPWIENMTDMSNLRITAPEGGWKKGTLADYMGLPTNVENIDVQRMPFNAYCKIYNDHFRDQGTQYALDFDIKTTTKAGSNGTTAVTDCALGGKPAKANKFHDYYTSCLPSPLRHAPVILPIGEKAPVYAGYEKNPTPDYGNQPIQFVNNSGQKASDGNVGIYDGNLFLSTTGAGGWKQTISPSNLVADLTQATGATIMSLYQAFALQSLYQAEARSGGRYNEIIYGHFGIKSPDARLQRSEYLGGKRIALNTEQVAATTSGTNQSIANLGAYSLTADKDDSFIYSAQEFGILMCLACVRAEHSYQQGIAREWSRKYKTDQYFPELSNIAEMAVLNKEIYAQGTSEDDEVFGYQEAWADYRYKPSRISGQLRSNAIGTLDTWHYADNYAELPTLSPTWLNEPTTNIDRTLNVSSEVSDQFICDFYFDSKWTREMPMFSIPGLKA